MGFTDKSLNILTFQVFTFTFMEIEILKITESKGQKYDKTALTLTQTN
mgnify:FL=1